MCKDRWIFEILLIRLAVWLFGHLLRSSKGQTIKFYCYVLERTSSGTHKETEEKRREKTKIGWINNRAKLRSRDREKRRWERQTDKRRLGTDSDEIQHKTWTHEIVGWTKRRKEVL